MGWQDSPVWVYPHDAIAKITITKINSYGPAKTILPYTNAVYVRQEQNLKGMLHERYKNTIPFSQRLNDFILKRASEIKYVEVEHGPNSLDKLRSETQRLGIMPVNTDHCDNNIFGSREINVAFRAWHDHIHLEHNLEFNLEGELRASFIQAAELPSDWYEERLLLIYEITGQALYFLSHGVFVENQRKFTNILHKTGKI